MVEFEKPIGMDFVLLAEDLENILQRKVDLVSKGALKPRAWQVIKKDLIYVWDWKLLIEDILESISRIELYTTGLSFDDFNLILKLLMRW